MKSLSDLALRYNDASVLESHHAAVTFGVLMTPETALVGRLPRCVPCHSSCSCSCPLPVNSVGRVIWGRSPLRTRLAETTS